MDFEAFNIHWPKKHKIGENKAFYPHFCSLNYTKYAFCIILYMKNTIPLKYGFQNFY